MLIAALLVSPPGGVCWVVILLGVRAVSTSHWRNMTDPKAPSTLHHFLDSDGLYKSMNIHTGEIVAIQREARELNFIHGEYEGLREVELPNGELCWVEQGLEDRVPKKTIKYNPTLAGAICSLVAEGIPLTDIAKRADMPNYSVLARWRRLYPDFSKSLEEARVDRTERFHDEAMAIADEAYKLGDDKMAGLAKLRVDVRKWAAEKGDQDRYATKTKVQAEGTMTIMVHTGILRPGDSGYIEQLKEVAQQEEIVETIQDSRAIDDVPGSDSGKNKVSAITSDSGIGDPWVTTGTVGEF